MEKIIKTEINKVFVYQQGARLVHKGEVHLEQGLNQIKIEQLTKFLDKESVRVKGKGKGKIININIERHTSKVSKNPQIDEIKTKIEDVSVKYLKIEKIMQELDKSSVNFEEFSSTFFKRAPVYFNRADLDLEKISAMDNFIQDRKMKFIDEQQQLEKKRQDLNKERVELQRELSNLSRPSKIEEFYDIVIILEAQSEGEFHLEIEFQIKQAYWVPFYDVNLLDDSAEIKLMANIFNQSQEDWSNVELEISSATLQPVRIIQPKPIIVREYHPPILRDHSPKKRSLPLAMINRMKASAPSRPPDMEMMEDMDELGSFMEEPKPELEQSHAQLSENMGVQSYIIPERMNIAGDNHPHPVTLMEITMESHKGYFWSSAAPSMTVIQDTLKNGDSLLFPGNAKIYFKNEFIGESQIPLIAPQETIELGTRRTYDLKIEKKLKKREMAKEGLLKGKITKFYEYEIKIDVLKPSDHQLKLMDNMLHSDSEKIKISKENFSIEPKSKKLGLLTWELNLKDQKELIINYSFEVTWEKDVQITPPLP